MTFLMCDQSLAGLYSEVTTLTESALQASFSQRFFHMTSASFWSTQVGLFGQYTHILLQNPTE
jgi:hypothetical protein